MYTDFWKLNARPFDNDCDARFYYPGECHQVSLLKLRYALEFFTSLYPAEEIKDLIRHLKSLQDYLGRLNDLAVQQHFLQSFLDELDAGQPGALPLAAAAGALIGRLHGEHGQRRQGFTEVFAAFQAPDLGARYRRLFSGREESA